MTEDERIRSGFGDVWQRVRPEIDGRVAAIERAVEALERGADNEEKVAMALAAAHKLAGVLGTFGLYHCGDLARRIEAELESSPPSAKLSSLAAELARLLADPEMEPSGAGPDPT